MSLADKYFIENCRDIIENGSWDTDSEVRPHWGGRNTRAYRKKVLRGEPL